MTRHHSVRNLRPKLSIRLECNRCPDVIIDSPGPWTARQPASRFPFRLGVVFTTEPQRHRETIGAPPSPSFGVGGDENGCRILAFCWHWLAFHNVLSVRNTTTLGCRILALFWLGVGFHSSPHKVSTFLPICHRSRMPHPSHNVSSARTTTFGCPISALFWRRWDSTVFHTTRRVSLVSQLPSAQLASFLPDPSFAPLFVQLSSWTRSLGA